VPIQGWVLTVGVLIGGGGVVLALIALVREDRSLLRLGASVALIGMAMVVAAFLALFTTVQPTDFN
jgi:hypothetical protein